MMTITHDHLDEIERGLAGVTPGPWHVEEMYAAAPVICDERSSAFACALPKQIAAHIARLDPQTVAELVRLARIGLEAGDHDLVTAAYLHGAADLKAAIARAAAAEKRVSMLECALAPFAKHYQSWMDKYADNITSSTFPIHTFGDLRRAREALGEPAK